MKKAVYIICSIVLIILAIVVIAALIKPVSLYGLKFTELAKTYSYTVTSKQFLKYENRTVYTTDGCSYEDKEKNFVKYLYTNAEYQKKEIRSVDVYTSNLTGEPFYVLIQTHSDVNFSILGSDVYNSYIVKTPESKNFLTFCAYLAPILFFVSVAASVFFTRNSKKRTIFVLFYFVALPLAALSHLENITYLDPVFYNKFSIVLAIATFIYGAAAYYTSRRVLIPSLILASSHTVLGAIGMSRMIKKPLDFTIQNCTAVIYAVFGALAVLLVQMILEFRKNAVPENNLLRRCLRPFDDLNPSKTDFSVKFIPALFLLLWIVHLEHQSSLLSHGDWGGLGYALIILFIALPLYGIVSNLFTSRIILPHVILIAIYISLAILASIPGFNTSSSDILMSAIISPRLLFSLIPALCTHLIRKLICRLIKKRRERTQQEEQTSLSQ